MQFALDSLAQQADDLEVCGLPALVLYRSALTLPSPRALGNP